MSSIADLTNAGTESPIPGYVLSKPGLLQIGKAERHFAERYVQTMAQGAAVLPPKQCADTMQAVAMDVKLAEFLYGGNVFYLWAAAASSSPYLILWSLQVKHPQMTIEKVVELLENHDANAIAKAALDLWFPPQAKRRRRRRGGQSIDWDAIYRQCTGPAPDGFGLTAEQFNALTIPQLTAMLGKGNAVSAEDEEELRRNGAFDQYDAICAAHGLTPATLAAKPDDELESLVREQMPDKAKGQAIDVRKLRQFVGEYAAEGAG